MKCKTILLWLAAALAAAICYLFCTVTCAPIRENNVSRLCDHATTIAFLVVLVLGAAGKVRKYFIHRQKLH